MANQTAYKPKVRIGIDWDGDGFIHSDGVAEGATPNEIEDALYQSLWVDVIEVIGLEIMSLL